jgi:hypothetical protein
MPYNLLMFTFIETRLFTRLIQEYLTDDEYQELQTTLMNTPDVGDVIPHSGGVRKLRWRAAGRGKRGGYRVIYFTRSTEQEIWLLTIYPKNVTENIPANVLRKIRKEIEDA